MTRRSTITSSKASATPSASPPAPRSRGTTSRTSPRRSTAAGAGRWARASDGWQSAAARARWSGKRAIRMATVKVFSKFGAPLVIGVHKPITNLGRALGNDVVLQGEGVADHHAQIVFDGRDFNLDEIDKHAEIKINGK